MCIVVPHGGLTSLLTMTHNKLLAFDAAFCVISYSFLYAWAGAVTCTLCIIKNMIYCRLQSRGVNSPGWLNLTFILLHIIIAVFSVKTTTGILPVVGAMISCLTYGKSGTMPIRLGMASNVILWLTYDILICSYINALAMAIALVFHCLQIYRHLSVEFRCGTLITGKCLALDHQSRQ